MKKQPLSNPPTDAEILAFSNTVLFIHRLPDGRRLMDEVKELS